MSSASVSLAILLALISLHTSAARKGCTFRHNGCMYNIHLRNDAPQILNDADKNEGGCGHKQIVNLDRAQNDYTAKIDDMEKNFSFLKDAHEHRIKELESTVRELLGLDKNPTKNRGVLEINKGDFSFGSLSLDNNELMNKLQEEFEKLRTEVKDKTTELIDTKIKLNETSKQMHEAHLKHFKAGQDLLSAENQIIMLKRERAVLKNQLKDRSYKLNLSTKKSVECEKKSTTQQDDILQLFRSESTLKEELMTTQLLLNKSKEEFTRLDSRHNELKTRLTRTRRIMKIREKELIQCYAAKTSTFCGFEDPKMCGFVNINDTSDFFDWSRAQGRTPSANTGPSKDHTCNGPSGHFMFIEASAKGRGSNAILYSPLYRGMNEQCVEFFYHMNGRHMGTLNVYAQARGDQLQSAWRAYGNQGDWWTNARLAIPKELAMAGYQIAFEGITENGYQGDMAIDDVSVSDGPCPLDEKVVAVKVAVNSTAVIKKGKTFARKLRRKLKRKSKTG